MLYNVMKGSEDEPVDENDLDIDPKLLETMNKNELSNKLEEKKDIFKNKIKFVSKMLKMQKILREERETIIQLKSKFNGLPRGILLEGGDGNPIF